jgi:type I restriction enzyme S subunit
VARERAPGVVTGRYGTIGEVFFIDEDYWPHNTTLFVKNFHSNDPLFVSYLLHTIDFQTHSGKSGVPGVNRNDLHALMVKVPPTVEEQRAIAGALGDMDALLSGLDRLIVKKGDLKQAAMQRLVSGETRLPGFQGEWGTGTLSSFVLSHNSGVYKKSELYGRGCNIIGVSDIYGIDCVDGQGFAHVPLSAAELARYSLKSNDLLYGESSLVREGIARTVYVTKRGAGTAFAWHTRRYSVDQSAVISSFLYYYLQGRRARKHMMDNCIQTAITGINTVAYFACPVLVPSPSEQTAIAEALSDMDAELWALEQRREKTRHLKQAMMQELLTGKTRLV